MNSLRFARLNGTKNISATVQPFRLLLSCKGKIDTFSHNSRLTLPVNYVR